MDFKTGRGAERAKHPKYVNKCRPRLEGWGWPRPSSCWIAGPRTDASQGRAGPGHRIRPAPTLRERCCRALQWSRPRRSVPEDSRSTPSPTRPVDAPGRRRGGKPRCSYAFRTERRFGRVELPRFGGHLILAEAGGRGPVWEDRRGIRRSSVEKRSRWRWLPKTRVRRWRVG
jgi:hypothetical protein